jgi:hypothetical protein
LLGFPYFATSIRARLPLASVLSSFAGYFKIVSTGLLVAADDWSEKADAYDGHFRIMESGAMWFQDAFNYDFAALVSSSTLVATQEGEISFSAYNASGWRWRCTSCGNHLPPKIIAMSRRRTGPTIHTVQSGLDR